MSPVPDQFPRMNVFRRRGTSAAKRMMVPALFGAMLSGTLLCPALAAAQSAGLAPSDPRFAPVVDTIIARYGKPLPRDSVERLLRTRGLEGLDPYSGLMSASEESQLRTAIAGSFVGIGAFFQPDSVPGGPRIADVFVNSPALAAGVRNDDAILSVDGRSTNGQPLDSVLPRLRGRAGTSVDVELRHRGDSLPVRVTIVRAWIATPSVRGMARASGGRWSYQVEGGDAIAYARITHFSATTVAELDSALRTIGRSGARSLILDLRGNVGGSFDAGVQAADLFLDSGVVVTERSRSDAKVYRATAGVATTLPVALLIDERTKSAGELFVAALQDHHRAIVVGQRSYGKGMVQQLIPLGGQFGSMRLSISTYIRPSGRIIERHATGGDAVNGGVWPDSGNDVVVASDVSKRVAERLEADDQQASLAHATISTISLASDPVLARAVDVLSRMARQ